jgi:hypothetical protein
MLSVRLKDEAYFKSMPCSFEFADTGEKFGIVPATVSDDREHVEDYQFVPLEIDEDGWLKVQNMEDLDDPEDMEDLDDPDCAKADFMQQSLKPAEKWLAEVEHGHILIKDFRSVERQHRDYENSLFSEFIESERIGDTESYDWKSFEVSWNKKVAKEEDRIRELPKGAPDEEKRIRLYRKTWEMLKMHYTSAVERCQTSHTRSSYENALQRIRDFVRNGGHTPQTGAESSGGRPAPPVNPEATDFQHMEPQLPDSVLLQGSLLQSHVVKRPRVSNSPIAQEEVTKTLRSSGAFNFPGNWTKPVDCYRRDRQKYIEEKSKKRLYTCSTCGHFRDEGPYKDAHIFDEGTCQKLCSVPETDRLGAESKYHGWCCCKDCKLFGNEELFRHKYGEGKPKKFREEKKRKATVQVHRSCK